MKFNDIKFESYLDGVSAKINFGHLTLSVVKHSGSYGHKDGLYEIGMFDDNGNMVEVPDITMSGDTVKGFQSEQDIDSIILKLKQKTGVNPEQVAESSVVGLSTS